MISRDQCTHDRWLGMKEVDNGGETLMVDQGFVSTMEPIDSHAEKCSQCGYIHAYHLRAFYVTDEDDD